MPDLPTRQTPKKPSLLSPGMCLSSSWPFKEATLRWRTVATRKNYHNPLFVLSLCDSPHIARVHLPRLFCWYQIKLTLCSNYALLSCSHFHRVPYSFWYPWMQCHLWRTPPFFPIRGYRARQRELALMVPYTVRLFCIAFFFLGIQD